MCALECEDLLGVILRQACLSPSSFVNAGRVCKRWREACLGDEALLLQAAKSSPYLTKGTLMGLFGLTSVEANRLPHVTQSRRGGVVYRFSPPIADEALRIVGGRDGVRKRLVRRAGDQRTVERALGEDWRRLQWSPLPRVIRT